MGVVIACTTDGANDEEAGPASRLEQLRAKIGKDAILPMERGEYPKLYARLGKAQFSHANAMTEWAALAAAESEQCPEVDLVGVSERATREEIEWYVDCSNGERFQITQAQAEALRERLGGDVAPQAGAESVSGTKVAAIAVAEPQSARWKNFDEASTVSACDLTVQKAMLVPGSFTTGWSRWAIEKDADTGIVIIGRDYKSENAYSMTINGRYRCTVDSNRHELVGLSIREPDGWHKLI